MKLLTLQAAETELAKYVPAVKQITGTQLNLDRMWPLMAAIGNPQEQLKIIHLAGTSGKTSTAYYIASLLQANGHKVGLTVSPHIDVITERVQVNLKPLGESEFCAALSEFLELIKTVEHEPTYFEILVAFAYWYFAKEGVDYVVAETGLGGLLDGTNVAQRSDKVCIITDIGLDHTHILGKTTVEIAAQKAGIIHSGNKAFIYQQASEVTDVFVDYARKQQADLQVLSQDDLAQKYASDSLDVLPLYQQRNWLLARAAAEYIGTRDGWEIQPADIERSLTVQVPGRMDIWQMNGKSIVMDGAHNQQKMEAFVASFQQKFPGLRVPILLAIKQGKEFQEILPLLQPLASQLIVTTYNILQDLPASSMEPEALAAAARTTGFTNVDVESDPRKAFQLLMNTESDTVLATGSFYLLSCIRPLIIKT